MQGKVNTNKAGVRVCWGGGVLPYIQVTGSAKFFTIVINFV